MSNPFKKIIKNSGDTQKKWERRETLDILTKKCPDCGAARPKDTNLTTCDYCGYKFMKINEKIKPDNI